MDLRYYQRDAVDSIYSYFSENNGNPLVVIPTAGGKSVIIATFIKEVLAQWANQRILILTHVKELVGQNYERMKQVWPSINAGIYSAGLNRRDTFQSVIFASIQSVYTKAWQLGFFDLIIVDECHLIPDGDEGMYKTFYAECKKINPCVKVIGFTATPFRMKSGHLIGDDTLFTDICYEISISELLEKGYLCPLVTKQTLTQIDTSNVPVRGGEFVKKALAQASDQDHITQSAVREMMEFGANRQSWLIFCCSIEHAQHVTDALRRNGITAEMVCDKTPKGERDTIVKKFANGWIRALVNVDVFTTGFDVPRVDLIAMLRKTKSPGLYIQIGGRGMRLHPNKTECLVLDFAGNTIEHGPIDAIRVKKNKGKKDTEITTAPVRKCPVCNTLCHAANTVCNACGYQWPLEERPLHFATAVDAPIMSHEAKPWYETATRAAVFLHRKPGSPDSVRVCYYNGMALVAQEWLHVERQGRQRGHAVFWWRKFVDMSPTPHKSSEFAEKLSRYELPRPVKLTLKKNGKYTEVMSYEFA